MFKQYFYNLKYGIQNLYRWFKIIFQDRDWDQVYIYEILKFKLERMIHYFENYGHAENNDITLRYMKICVKLLDRIIKEDFRFTEGMLGDVTWIPLDEKEELFEMKVEYKVPKEVFKNAMDKGDALKAKYKKTLFSVLEKRIERFWD